jgi:L-amino acid N-acyltransferase YncA
MEAEIISDRNDHPFAHIFVRAALEDDAAEITRIYNQGIEDRATFETEPREISERKQWLSSRNPRHPVIVALRDDRVQGWAALNSFNPREAYRFVADLSIYVAREARGTGVGSALMADLIERARAVDYHKIVLATFPHSAAALGLYERFGFRTVGDYKEQGLLDGRWTDTRIMELLL